MEQIVKFSRYAGSTIYLYYIIDNDKSGQAPNTFYLSSWLLTLGSWILELDLCLKRF